VQANWSNKKLDASAEKNEVPVFKEVEKGSKGHYDFLFKNTAGQDVEVVGYVSNCDCASMEACAVDPAAWASLKKQQDEKPADELAYATAPTWKELVKHPEWEKNRDASKRVLVKAGEGGVVRVRWNATKSPGQTLAVTPAVVIRLVADHARAGAQKLHVPVMVSAPVRFLPPRVDVGVLSAGANVTERFYAWSTTQPALDLKLTASPADELFEVTATRLKIDSEVGELQAILDAEAKNAKRAAPTILSAYRINVKVHESAGGKQLDLGSFYRRLEVTLNGIPRHEDLPGPEIVGRVQGMVTIGGAADERKVRFKSFKKGDSKTVELSTGADIKLEPYLHKPDWIKADLTRAKAQPDPKLTFWNLTVTVPDTALSPRSFDEPDAVTLRIVGTPERFVRIPLEGHYNPQSAK
jgi:hypothetical protein